MRIRNIALLIIAVVVVAVLLIVGGIWAPTTLNTPADQQVITQNTPNGMSRGAYVARLSDCTACHTTDANKPFAGGLGMPLPMGTLYSTNITPDKTYGIGDYSLSDFKRVLREGISKDGSALYPAMPYTEYTKLSDADIKALYDYFMTEVKPVSEPNRHNDIPALLSFRWPLKLWNWMFVDQGAYAQKADKDDAWNRGAYLVQGAAHCGTCHTPRGVAMETVSSDELKPNFLAGADLAGWHAFNITSDQKDGIGSWSNAEIVQYLKTGSVPGKAQAAGPMAEAVENSFRFMTDEDLNAIATYLKTVPAASGNGDSRFVQGKAQAQDLELRGLTLADAKAKAPGASLYMGNCSTCHDSNASGSPDGYYPSLYHNSVIGSDKTGNLIQVILHGVKRTTNDGEVMMPGFAKHLSDDEIATLVNFLTRTYGQADAQVKAADVAKLRSAE